MKGTEKKMDGETRGHRKERIGIVARAKMAKTIVVEVERLAQHPVYTKVVRKRKRYVVHDEKGIAKAGDKIRMVESRPLSKTKQWRLVEVRPA